MKNDLHHLMAYLRAHEYAWNKSSGVRIDSSTSKFMSEENQVGIGYFRQPEDGSKQSGVRIGQSM